MRFIINAYRTVRGGEQMSEKENKILETMSKMLPDMEEEEKMYLLGQAEGMAFMKRKQKPKKPRRQNNKKAG